MSDDLELFTLAGMLGVPLTAATREHLEALAAHRRQEGIREHRSVGAVEAAGLAPSPQRAREGRPAAGKLARYELEESPPAGEGEVAARDPDLGRPVLLRLADARHPLEFAELRRLHARLEHPNIQPLHDIGLDPASRPAEARPFTVEDRRASDPTLATLLDAATDRDRARLLGCLRDVAAALAHAHRAGVARGGLHPGQVTVGPFGEVVVWDWNRAVNIQGSAGGEEAQAQDLRDLAELARRVAAGPDGALPEDLRRPVEVLQAGQGSAAALGAAIAAHQERAAEARRQRRAARADVTRARKELERWQAAIQQEERLRQQVEALTLRLTALPHDAPPRQELWALRRQRKEARVAAEQARADAFRYFQAARGHDPLSPEAREGLAELHWACLEEAERWGRRDEAARHAAEVRRLDRGALAAALDGPGRLRVETRPEGAEVQVRRYEPRQEGLLEARPAGSLGRTPTAEAELPQGSYLLVVEREGCAAVRYPLRVGRRFQRTVRIDLLTPEEVGAGMIHVPAGPYLTGGDPEVPRAGPRRSVELPAFCIGRTHVTCGEYLEFLDDLASRDPEAAARHAPRSSAGDAELWDRQPDGTYALPPRQPGDRIPWAEDLPVLGVSLVDAETYLAWRAQRDSRPYQPPPCAAWEKAARGADGRTLPWGDLLDASLANMGGHTPDRRPHIQPVGQVATDESPYGLRDLAGNVVDWCQPEDPHQREELGLGVLCGGDCTTFGNYSHLTSTRRFWADQALDTCSFRRFFWVPERA